MEPNYRSNLATSFQIKSVLNLITPYVYMSLIVWTIWFTAEVLSVIYLPVVINIINLK